MLNEKQLVEQCISNSDGALDELYLRYAPILFGICLRYTRNQEEAEDLLHDGFIRILDQLKFFRQEGSFEGWLRRIMVTSAINHYRKNKQRGMDQELTEYRLNNWSSDPVMDDLSMNELLEAIRELPEGYQMVFNLHVMDGYKHREIGEMLDISESTSKSQFMKARLALQQKIIGMNREARPEIEKSKTII
ncbi:MAG: sigma-70 family RNA polymerase sigma factor [Bacteroidales bacterium]|nr:sigma-70 family RNA polymerase sigma factor [Bacteroidales bacterium]MCF8459042.1 sigma-70 family RNA polymerase sigma factor [Bacteroidales bacterium]